MAGTQFLCFADLVLYKGVSSYTINSCEPIEIFYNIRLDVDKLTIASEIAKITNDVTDENEYSYNILQLVLNTLYMISETEKDLDFILSVFKLRLLSLIGFRPEIEKCTECGTKENLKYFSFKDHGLKCEACGKQDKGAIEISESTVKAIKWIIWADPKKIFQFDLSEDNKQQLKILTKIYLNNCIEKEYK
jgi:DNA repair protein RecO (recombination protein O)